MPGPCRKSGVTRGMCDRAVKIHGQQSRTLSGPYNYVYLSWIKSFRRGDRDCVVCPALRRYVNHVSYRLSMSSPVPNFPRHPHSRKATHRKHTSPKTPPGTVKPPPSSHKGRCPSECLGAVRAHSVLHIWHVCDSTSFRSTHTVRVG